MNKQNFPIEILAPAGDFSVLEAAIDAGAHAVYLGLNQFNARRGAKNFSADELRKGVELAHAKGVKVYLTLNIDLSQRELNQALRAIQLAEDCKVDAVLIRDPALLKLIPHFPQLKFHFSTQAAISSTAGMQMAKSLGIQRVVLARELSENEIKACAQVADIETEVFVQGAMCFSLSGRCLMSSWVGGRSGNRGTCASPCRVGWGKNEEETECYPFSMHDLSLVQQTEKLIQMGVDSLKIEGRLKRAPWVQRAISQFKNLKDNMDNALGEYTGREQTDGYFTGQRNNMVGESGRVSATECELNVDEPNVLSDQPTAIIHATQDEKKGINFTFKIQNENGIFESEYRLPFRPVKKVKKALTLADLFENLKYENIETNFNCELDLEMLLVPTSVNQVIEAYEQLWRQSQKTPDTTLRNAVSEEKLSLFQSGVSSSTNNKPLGTLPNRIKANLNDVIPMAEKHPHLTYITPCYTASDVVYLDQKMPEKTRKIIALQSVIYEVDIPQIRAVLEEAEKRKIAVEVQGWDSLQLAKEYHVAIEMGAGMGCLNAISAQQLEALGCRTVATSIEMDQSQLEALTQASATPLTIQIFGRPPLFITRIEPQPCFKNGEKLTDARGTEIQVFQEGNVWVYRPVSPYYWGNLVNAKIKAQHYVADLIGDPTPLKTLDQILNKKIPVTGAFNYAKTLR